VEAWFHRISARIDLREDNVFIVIVEKVEMGADVSKLDVWDSNQFRLSLFFYNMEVIVHGHYGSF
jgi:hypothetical protein